MSKMKLPALWTDSKWWSSDKSVLHPLNRSLIMWAMLFIKCTITNQWLLRVPDIHEAQKQSSFMFCLIFFSIHNVDYQKSEWYFFDQGPIDGKSEVKVEKHHLVAELKLKMLNLQKVTFSISTLPPGDTFEFWTHFSHLWTIGQKSIIQIFDMLYINKFYWNLAECISGILNVFSLCFCDTLIHQHSPMSAFAYKCGVRYIVFSVW